MGFPRELLDSAVVLYQAQPETQANLRRAVSTAYYALFHFLIEETCRNWARAEQRDRLVRKFEHGRMADASARMVREHKNAAAGSAEFHLYAVAYAFTQLRQNRERADYDLSGTLSDKEVALDILSVEDAFMDWEKVRSEQIAQDYLFSLLFKDK